MSDRVPKIIIRTAIPRDILGLTEVLTNSFHPPQGLSWWVHPILKLGVSEDLRHRLRSNSSRFRYICLVASTSVNSPTNDKDEIVGTVEMSIRSNSFWQTIDYRYPYVANLAVKNSYRRKGIARKLLRKCEQIASEWGFTKISLHVLENNEGAKQLYLTSGYEIHQMESSLSSCFFNSPKRLLLNKEIRKLTNEEKNLYLKKIGNFP